MIGKKDFNVGERLLFFVEGAITDLKWGDRIGVMNKLLYLGGFICGAFQFDDDRFDKFKQDNIGKKNEMDGQKF